MWDLHVHTPNSHTAQYGSGEAAWAEFLTDLRSLPNSMTVIGINDYLWVDGYERVSAAHRAGDLPNIEAIFPVVELRLNDFIGTTGKLARVNAHVIFKPDTEPELIRQQFISRLVSSFRLADPYLEFSSTWSALPTREAIEELGQMIKASVPAEELHRYGGDLEEGFNNWVISLEAVIEACDGSSFPERPLLALGKTEWEDIPWNDNTIAAKKNLINSADLVFTAAADPAAFHRSAERLRLANVNHRLLDCSDAHRFASSNDKDRLGNCFTWICADPTLAGLKHALHEYPARVYVGSKPNLLLKQQSDPTNFVSRITIRSIDNVDRPPPAFGVDLPLNAGFIAVIGNKGSGKSALLDTVALVANSHSEEQFSFLTEQRFRSPLNNKATYYEATLERADGEVVGPKRLSSNTDPEAPERVRYLPQSLLERLCNKRPDAPDDEFETELRSIIFSHVPHHQRLGCKSLDELLQQRSSSLDREVSRCRSKLTDIDKAIADLEEKRRPSRLVALRKSLHAVEGQLKQHDALRPPDPVPPPDLSAGSDEDPTVKALSELRRRLASLDDQIASYEVEHSHEHLRANSLDNLRREIDVLRSLFEEFMSRAAPLAADSGLDLDQIVSLHIDTEPVAASQARSTERLQELAAELASDGDAALQRAEVVAEIGALEQALNEPQRRYEQQRADLTAWQTARERLVGDGTTVGTLDYFTLQLAEVERLPAKLEDFRSSRLKLSQSIHALLLQKVDMFKEFYGPVQLFLHENELARDHFSLEFEAGLEFRDFGPGFLAHVDRGVTGTFYGVDASQRKVAEFVRTTDPGQWESLSAFLETVDASLRSDSRDGSSTDIDCAADALRKGVSLEGLYDYVFGLSYIEAQFELRSENRPISELSPGQKGTILLMFYLLVDRSGRPILLDQPDENLDNQTVHSLLRPAIRAAKCSRQVIVVTHSPNLAVVGDADQVIVASCDGSEFAYCSGSIEDPAIRDLVVEVLEGTWPAFRDRQFKYTASALQAG